MRDRHHVPGTRHRHSFGIRYPVAQLADDVRNDGVRRAAIDECHRHLERLQTPRAQEPRHIIHQERIARRDELDPVHYVGARLGRQIAPIAPVAPYGVEFPHRRGDLRSRQLFVERLVA